MRTTEMLGALAVALSLSSCARYDLDRQLEEFCKRDGGMTIYETVTLSPAEYQRVFNSVSTAKSRDENYGPEYRYELRQEILIGKNSRHEMGEAQISRWHSAIYRRSDNRLLGESVTYTRSGGDGFTFGAHPSSDVCPKANRGLGQTIFLRQVK